MYRGPCAIAELLVYRVDANRLCQSIEGLLSVNHRLHGSASPVLTATGIVNGKGQFLTPYRIDTPQLITKIFVTGDCVSDPYSCAKLGAHPGGRWANG